jgi:hypothetical protein
MFRKRKIIFTGRDTFTFSDSGRIYFVYGEMQASGEFDLAIGDHIYYMDKDEKIIVPEKELNELLNRIELELNKQGVVPLMPCNYFRLN